MAENINQSTTQQFLDIHDITNDLVIMKDGTTSLILSVDAMNFGLLAEEEQDSIIYAYAGLLNSLNYPIQIIVKSQTKDVSTYLKLLQEQEALAESPENRQRIRRYREFVGNLIHERNVLDKKFYVVIPAAPLELGLLSAQSVLPGKQTFDVTSIERSVLLDKAKNILEPKRDHLISQFARIGLNSRQLGTQEIIQYFYISYNPEAAEGQEIADSNSYSTPLVKASFEGFSMPQTNQPPQQQPAENSVAQPVPQQPVAPAALDVQAASTAPGVQVTPAAPVAAPPTPTDQLTNQAAVQSPTPEQTTEVSMPPGTTVPDPSQTNGQIPVEKQPIQTPTTEEAAAAQPITPQASEVELPPNQDQQVAGQQMESQQTQQPQQTQELDQATNPPTTPTTPQLDPEQTMAQEEINKTLGALGTESTNLVQPLENPVVQPQPAAETSPTEATKPTDPATPTEQTAPTEESANNNPPPIAEIK